MEKAKWTLAHKCAHCEWMEGGGGGGMGREKGSRAACKHQHSCNSTLARSLIHTFYAVSLVCRCRKRLEMMVNASTCGRCKFCSNIHQKFVRHTWIHEMTLKYRSYHRCILFDMENLCRIQQKHIQNYDSEREKVVKIPIFTFALSRHFFFLQRCYLAHILICFIFLCGFFVVAGAAAASDVTVFYIISPSLVFSIPSNSHFLRYYSLNFQSIHITYIYRTVIGTPFWLFPSKSVFPSFVYDSVQRGPR